MGGLKKLNKQHNVIFLTDGEMLVMSANPRELDPKTPTQPKPSGSDTVRREIDRIARQLEGLSKSLKRLKDAA